MRALRAAAVALLGAAAVALLPSAAGAQQLVDAGSRDNGSGAIAFVAFTLMVFAIGFALFFMDRVRRRASQRDEE
jgi:ABC-type proline/glycine betaine transport system permease subunit